MINNNQRTSLLINSQLPDYIRSDPNYSTFIRFIEAYYEWMENGIGGVTVVDGGSNYQYSPIISIEGDGTGAAAISELNNGSILKIIVTSSGSGYSNASVIITPDPRDTTGSGGSAYVVFNSSINPEERTKNLLNYKDIDKTTDEFINYFVNEFLQYFPQNTLINKSTAVKASKELYSAKGTPAAYDFLFRVLFNSDFDSFYTKELVLRASDGVWYVAKSLKLATNDPRFLEINNYRILGETSKSIATIESSIIAGNRIEVFISNIFRLFQSGESIRIVDNNNQDVIIDGLPLLSKIVGQVSRVSINPNFRGQYYSAGDPVIVYGGLNDPLGKGAIAEVGTVTSGSIDRMLTLNGGFGYVPYKTLNYGTSDIANSRITLTNAPGSNVIVASLNTTFGVANASFVPSDTILSKANTLISSLQYDFDAFANSNANTALVNAFSFYNYRTYPISSVSVISGGTGLTNQPIPTAESLYVNDENLPSNLKNLGILAPIQIVNGGLGYLANDKIVISGGTGYGARANIISVSGSGSITNVQYVYDSSVYPLGGLGYNLDNLPTISVTTSTGSNATLSIPGILGDGAIFNIVTERIGSITSIKLLEGGEDYVSTPNVSLQVNDVVVSNVSISHLPIKGDIIFQGSSVNVSSYRATVNSISLIQPYSDPAQSLYNLRVFNYTSRPNTNLPFKIERDSVINITPANIQFSPLYDINGIRNYGDGRARATASFLNGLVLSDGTYLNTRGQPSGSSVLQSDIYNNFTYTITVEREISKYREILLNLLHPGGTKLIGRYAVKSNSSVDLTATNSFYSGYPLSYHTGNVNSSVSIVGSFTNKSNNILKLNNLDAGVNIAQFIFANTSIIQVVANNGINVISKVVSVNSISNTVTVEANTWVTYSNVAYITANSGSNVINITSITNSYDIVNNGNYSNTLYPLKDIIVTGDIISIDNNTVKTVTSVNYTENYITVNNNLTNNSISLLSVNRTVESKNVIIY